MAQLEIFQNGTSLHPDTMGDPVFQIGTKNDDGSYDVVVFEGMTKEEAESKLKELQPVKVAPKEKAVPKKKVVKKVSKKDATKKFTKKEFTKKKAAKKKKKKR
jgi:type II secretory pathway component PulF